MKKYLAILLSVLLLLCACQKEKPIDLSKFEIVNKQFYAQDGIKYISYRMTISSNPTDDELLAAFESILDDGYDLHTIWFYNTIEETKGAYTIAMIEQKSDGTTVLKRRETAQQNS